MLVKCKKSNSLKAQLMGNIPHFLIVCLRAHISNDFISDTSPSARSAYKCVRLKIASFELKSYLVMFVRTFVWNYRYETGAIFSFGAHIHTVCSDVFLSTLQHSTF